MTKTVKEIQERLAKKGWDVDGALQEQLFEMQIPCDWVHPVNGEEVASVLNGHQYLAAFLKEAQEERICEWIPVDGGWTLPCSDNQFFSKYEHEWADYCEHCGGKIKEKE
jgi:hypothetical protein